MAKADDVREAHAALARGDWRSAHEIVQADEESRLSCWAHGIVHLIEGDLPNARYWYRKAGRPFTQDVAAEIAALGFELTAQGTRPGSRP
jgi:hypothetical protein